METNSYLWLILGLMLIAVELMTGTFYLLVLGLSALIGGLAAYLGGNFLIQALFVSMTAVAGVFLVNRWHKNQKALPKGGNDMDVGQSVVFESWINESARLGRVKYRGASWDAHLKAEAVVRSNDILYICGREGSQLEVSPAKPA